MTACHIVLFKLKVGIERDDPRVKLAAELSESHADHIPDIRSWWTAFGVGDRPVSADFVVVGLFEDIAAIRRYLEHPHHLLGVEAWKSVASWTVVDSYSEGLTIKSV